MIISPIAFFEDVPLSRELGRLSRYGGWGVNYVRISESDLLGKPLA